MAASTADTAVGPRTRTRQRNGAQRNINDLERLASVAVGGVLAALALRRRSVPGLAIGALGGALVRRGVTGHCDLYQAIGVSTADAPQTVTRQHGAAAVLEASGAQRVERSVTIFGKSPSELFAFWRDFTNLPRVMKHLESVEVQSDTRSRWTAKAPAGRTVSWDAEVYNELPDELIAWRSLDGAMVPNAGSVRFKALSAGRGTEVKVVLEYDAPGGALGTLVAKLFGEEPDVQVREDLRRFKALMEAGEIPVSENPGSGVPARETWDGRANQDAKVRDLASPSRPHDPTFQPTPSDQARGTVTTQPSEARA